MMRTFLIFLTLNSETACMSNCDKHIAFILLHISLNSWIIIKLKFPVTHKVQVLIHQLFPVSKFRGLPNKIMKGLTEGLTLLSSWLKY